MPRAARTSPAAWITLLRASLDLERAISCRAVERVLVRTQNFKKRPKSAGDAGSCSALPSAGSPALVSGEEFDQELRPERCP